MFTRYRLGLVCLCASLAIAVLIWHNMDINKSMPKTSFVLLSGETLETERLTGHVAIIHFWATSCTTCIQEIPQLIQLYEKFRKQGLEMVAVAMSYDPPMYVVNYAQTRKLPFKVAMDSNGAVSQAFGNVRVTPTTFVINKDGKIIKQYVGEPPWQALEALIQKSL